MANKYKDLFLSLYKRKKAANYVFFTEVEEEISFKPFKFLVCNIDLDILKCAVELAKEKSQFTMNQNQANIPRSETVKVKKCAQGILAEMFVHFLLVERYGFNVKRFDLERDSFEYSTDEYDLKIIVDSKEYEVESRSSNIHHFSIRKFVKEDVMIGPYGNASKIMDEYADLHFRPIYMPEFFPFSYEDGGKVVYNKKMIDGSIRLVITGVATKEDFLKNGRNSSLGQRGTTYHVVDISKIGDITEMDKKIKELIK